MQLTPTQKKAVEHTSGPLLIIAGAGTGKTTVLVEKILHLIDKKKARPDQIVALTFTDKAAREMEERVDKAIPYGYFQMEIATFHSFCDKILRDEAVNMGLSPNYKLHTQAQSVIFLKKHLFVFDLEYFRPLGNPNKFIEGLLQHFSRLRDEDVSPEEYLKWAKKQIKSNRHSGEKQSDDSRIDSGPVLPAGGQARMTELEKYLELARAYNTFQRLKIKENVLDFGDIIYYTTKLFKKRSNILEQYRTRFTHILVDEFQDTNIAQYNLIKLLAPPNKKNNLTVIGDDNQSIYKFRGASVSNILAFMTDYKKAKSVVLTENFRSNQAILDLSYNLIKHNDPDTLESRLGISKNLKSVSREVKKNPVRYELFNRIEDEATYVTSEIKNLKKKYQWSDFAVLVRANNHADPFIRALQIANIPYQFLGPGSLFKQPEIKDLIAYLFFLNDSTDSTSLYRVLSMDLFSILEHDIMQLLGFTKKTSLTLFETIEAHVTSNARYAQYTDHLLSLNPETIEKINIIFALIQKNVKAIKKETAGQILYDFIQESGYLTYLMDHTSDKKQKIAINISRFFDTLKSFETEEEDASIAAVVDYLTMSMELKESPTVEVLDKVEQNAVTIMTVHSAKGLEFPVVFVVNMTSDRFPTKNRSEQIPIPDPLIKEELPIGDHHMQEERRLFYVALTRAKDYIRLTSSNFYGAAKRQKKVSPFVGETIGEEVLAKIIMSNKDEKLQLSIFDPATIGASYKKNTVTAEAIPLKLDTFSYSQLETYKICPLRYKYQYVLKIPIPPNAASSFGSTIHEALQLFYERHRAGLKPDLDDLLNLYATAWIPIGYTSKNFEAKRKEQGVQFLTSFYKKYHRKSLSVIDIERWFKIKIADNIFINGKIDRVDGNLSGPIEIIDYKTGKKPAQAELKKSLQMGIYALAAKDEGLYDKKDDDITLTFYFLQSDEKISMQKNADDLEHAKIEIATMVESINAQRFEPKVGPWCQFCPFKINCEAWQ